MRIDIKMLFWSTGLRQTSSLNLFASSVRETYTFAIFFYSCFLNKNLKTLQANLTFVLRRFYIGHLSSKIITIQDTHSKTKSIYFRNIFAHIPRVR